MNFLNKFLKPLNIQVNKSSSLKNEKNLYEGRIKRLAEFYYDFNDINIESLNCEISGIVFSKDRAMQLHALLSSYFHYTKNSAPLKILYTYSNEQHKQAYEILHKELDGCPVEFILESDFSLQLTGLIHQLESDRLFFMTDDGIFLDHYDLSDCLKFDPLQNIFSLRLGADMNFCYTYNRRQDVPVFSTENICTWTWNDMKDSPDWIYPLSVDATIFCKKEVEMILDHISFKSPNSLESQMQLYNDLFVQRKGVCFSKVKYVNIPCNIVQNEFDNISTGTFSVTELAQRFLDGKRINWSMLENYKARDAQIVKFTFV